MPTKRQAWARRVCSGNLEARGTSRDEPTRAARLAGGEVRGCCNQTPACPTTMGTQEADNVSSLRWNGARAALAALPHTLLAASLRDISSLAA